MGKLLQLLRWLKFLTTERLGIMACPGHCHCQWGWSGIVLGIFIVLAACVFTFFPVFLDLFAWQWYEALCVLWFAIGFSFLTCGIIFECLGVWKPTVKAQEIVDEDAAAAPTHYVMIA